MKKYFLFLILIVISISLFGCAKRFKSDTSITEFNDFLASSKNYTISYVHQYSNGEETSMVIKVTKESSEFIYSEKEISEYIGLVDGVNYYFLYSDGVWSKKETQESYASSIASYIPYLQPIYEYSYDDKCYISVDGASTVEFKGKKVIETIKRENETILITITKFGKTKVTLPDA